MEKQAFKIIVAQVIMIGVLYIYCLFSVSVFSNDQELSHLWKSGYDSELIAYFEKNPDQLKEPRDLSKNLASSITRARHELFLWLLSKTEKVDKDVVRSALYKTKYLEKVLQKADKDVVNEAFESALNYQSLNFSIDALSMLVAKGADVNKAFKNKQYPIHMATLMGSGYLKVLVDAGADVNVKGPYENTPLHDAASRGKFHSFLYLLKNGADPEIKTKSGKTVKEAFSGYARNLVKHYFETGETPADYWMLKLAIDENDELALREVLSRKKELVNFKFAYPVINQKNVEISVVKYAQDARKDTALKILLEYGAPHDEGKENAMFHLATLGDVDTLEKILKVKPVDTLDKNGTPLWFYARNLETFKLLFVDKHGFDYRDKLNRGAIFGRNYYDDSFFRYLVENIKDKNKVDYDGKNTYHYLANGRNLELLEKALSS